MKLKHFMLAAVIGTASMGMGAHAQMAVIDVKGISEAVKQVNAWKQQYAQMTQQIASMTGDRGMANLLSASKTVLPADWQRAMQDISPLAAQIKAAQSVLSPAQLAAMPPQLRALVDQAATQSAVNQATAQVAYNDANVRQARLRRLTTSLATAIDPKAAYDLGNAIAIERGYLEADHNQLQAAANGAAAQAVARERIINEMRATSAGTGNFPKIDISLP